jgi:hypothetical protein
LIDTEPEVAMDILAALSDRDWARMNTLAGVPEELVYAVKSRQSEQALGLKAALKIGLPLVVAAVVVPPLVCLALGWPYLAIVWGIIGFALLNATLLWFYLGDMILELRIIADVALLCEKRRTIDRRSV